MRIFAWLFALLFGLSLVLFAVSNRAAVAIGFWPLHGSIPVPVFLPVLVLGFAAFLVGSIVTWLSSAPTRRLSRRRRRRIADLEQQIARFEERERTRAEAAAHPSPGQPPPVLRQISGGRS